VGLRLTPLHAPTWSILAIVRVILINPDKDGGEPSADRKMSRHWRNQGLRALVCGSHLPKSQGTCQVIWSVDVIALARSCDTEARITCQISRCWVSSPISLLNFGH